MFTACYNAGIAWRKQQVPAGRDLRVALVSTLMTSNTQVKSQVMQVMICRTPVTFISFSLQANGCTVHGDTIRYEMLLQRAFES